MEKKTIYINAGHAGANFFPISVNGSKKSGLDTYLAFKPLSLGIGILLENKTATEIANKIQSFKMELKSLGFAFGEITPLLLTDNGGEFNNVSAFENDPDGNTESHMFFCEPCSPHEKAEIEKNHALFRDIVPSGTSFDDFSQETVDLIFSHVNAVKRKQFNGKSAYDMFSFSYSEILASALGISFIPANQVIQSPKLLKVSFS